MLGAVAIRATPMTTKSNIVSRVKGRRWLLAFGNLERSSSKLVHGVAVGEAERAAGEASGVDGCVAMRCEMWTLHLAYLDNHGHEACLYLDTTCNDAVV